MTALAVVAATFAVSFSLLALWTAVQWWRWRTRANAYLAAGFVALAIAVVISRVEQLTAAAIPMWDVVSVGLNLVLTVFPWLVAAAIWSMRGRRPGWSWIGLVGVPVLSGWLIFATLRAAPVGDVEQLVFLGCFGVLWATPAVASAVHLRRAARRYPLARPRMRLISVGFVILTLALLTDLLAVATQAAGLILVMNIIALAAALVLLAGFLAPRPLRLWWRRNATGTFQQLQSDLIAAVSRDEVAAAIVPHLSSMLGTGVAVLSEDGVTLAASGMADTAADEAAAALAARQPLDPAYQVTAAGRDWLLVVSTPYTPVFGQDEQELVEAFASHLRIATERAELFETLQEQQRDVESLLLGLAHDIRSPTAAISGTSQLLVDTDDRSERAELAEILTGSAAYLDRLVDAMMELGRIRTTHTEREPVHLAEVASTVAERVRANHPNVSVRIHGDATVTINPLRAEQLLDNLISNAAKHGARDDLTITVEMTHTPSYVTLAVGDNGIGIAPADRERIFAPFQQGTAVHADGEGLGLGLVRRIVEDLGGRITLRQTEQGACFEVSFPVTATGQTDPVLAE